MNPRLLKQFLSALGAVALVSGCDLDSKVVQSDDRSAGGSDEIDTRIAVDRTGSPVAAARVALVKAGDSSGTALAVSATGSDGTYPAFVVPDGYYSLLVRDSSGATGRYVDSVRVVSRKLPTGRDTLLSLGSVSGVVRLLSGDSPTSVRLGLVGTDILSSAKSDGTFKIDLVPGGLYTLGAESSLDGYDRIYTRIQLKDGQNLVLPDTLVLPFTGLPAPTGLQVSQDTATGNVSVKWSAVRNPDLLGYVLERVENGTVTESQFLTDTMWTDSLGAYWEALPLLGPWPDRNVTYRVRARSASGAEDTKSEVQQLVAKPPMWTTLQESIEFNVTIDSVTKVSGFYWGNIRNPRFEKWIVLRTTSSDTSCSDTLVDSKWNDGGCRRLDDVVLDSVLLGNSSTFRRLRQGYSSKSAFVFKAMMNDGRELEVGKVLLSFDDKNSVVWRDSMSLDAGKIFLRRVGKWVVWQEPGKRPKISTDGIEWEDLPIWQLKYSGISMSTDTTWEIVSAGDSLWLCATTGSSLVIQSRMDRGQWISRLVGLPKDYRVMDFWGFDGHVVTGGVMGTFTGDYDLKRNVGDNLIEFSFPDLGAHPHVTIYPVDWRGFDEWKIFGWGCVFSESSKEQIPVWNGDAGAGSFIDFVDDVGVLKVINRRTEYFLVLDRFGSDGIELNSPPGTMMDLKSNFVYPGAIFFNHEIWLVNSGHLWKGKLNLPE